MDSTINALESMETSMYGKCSLRSFNICPYLLLLKIKFSVFTVDYHLKYKELIKSKLSIDFKIFHIVDHFVIYFGLILLMMVNLALEDHQEVLDFAGVKI